METVSGLAELRAKVECRLSNLGTVKLHVLSTRLLEVGLSLWLGRSLQYISSLFCKVCQDVYLDLHGTMLTNAQLRVQEKDLGVNRDKTGMALLPAL